MITDKKRFGEHARGGRHGRAWRPAVGAGGAAMDAWSVTVRPRFPRGREKPHPGQVCSPSTVRYGVGTNAWTVAGRGGYTRGIFAKRTQMELLRKRLNMRILTNNFRFSKSRKRTQTNPNQARLCGLQPDRPDSGAHRDAATGIGTRSKREEIFPKHLRVKPLNPINDNARQGKIKDAVLRCRLFPWTGQNHGVIVHVVASPLFWGLHGYLFRFNLMNIQPPDFTHEHQSCSFTADLPTAHRKRVLS